MPPVTLQLSPRAYAYGKRKTKYRKYGLGAFISECLVAQEAYEQGQDDLRRQLAKPEGTSRQTWDETGCCVD
jgi:hypothetical protein